MTKNDKKATVALQSLGEAHLYVAIAKLDGSVSQSERLFSGVHAIKAQRLYDVLKINSDIAERVKKDVISVIDDSSCHAWTSNDHYLEAIRLLREAKAQGNWSVSLASLKHDNGLLQVAMLDEYTFAESKGVKEIIKRMEKDLQ